MLAIIGIRAANATIWEMVFSKDPIILDAINAVAKFKPSQPSGFLHFSIPAHISPLLHSNRPVLIILFVNIRPDIQQYDQRSNYQPVAHVS